MTSTYSTGRLGFLSKGKISNETHLMVLVHIESKLISIKKEKINKLPWSEDTHVH